MRAFTPWPGSYCSWNQKRLIVLEGGPIDGRGEVGLVKQMGNKIVIGTAEGLSSDKNITWKNIGGGAWVFDQDVLAENDLSVTGELILNEGLEIRNSDVTNTLKFGPNINVFASGDDLNTLATDKNIFVEGGAIINQPLILASNAIITGDVFVSGNTVFGDTSGDTTTFRSTINSNITPTANNTHDLGAPDLIWRG